MSSRSSKVAAAPFWILDCGFWIGGRRGALQPVRARIQSKTRNPKFKIRIPMSDEQPKKRPLSEIGHLFLSDVRDRHTGGLPPPRRTPPGGRVPPPLPPRESVDLTPDEHADAFGPAATATGSSSTESGSPTPTTPTSRRTSMGS